MKRRAPPPQTFVDRFEASLDANPSPALEGWRWSREAEGRDDPRAVAAAWDLVTRQASAEAAMLNQLIAPLEGEASRTLLPALVVAGARFTEVGALHVIGKHGDKPGKTYVPRDLSFVPGREHPPATMTIHTGVEIGRSVADFLVRYRHEAFVDDGAGGLRTFVGERTLAVLIDEGPTGRGADRERRQRDFELQQQDHLVVRVGRSQLWQDAIGTAMEMLRTLVESTRFDVEQSIAAVEADPGE
ncbi:MAG: hypothetical protein AAF645_11490 [Myxococcota bacterium]